MGDAVRSVWRRSGGQSGHDRASHQQYRCRPCRHRFTARSTSDFCGFRFPDDIIAVAVR